MDHLPHPDRLDPRGRSGLGHDRKPRKSDDAQIETVELVLRLTVAFWTAVTWALA
jgi:hypothetical protein